MFKAEAYLLTESMDKDGNCSGEMNDHGLQETITANTLEALMDKLHRQWNSDFIDSLEVYEDQIEGNTITREDGIAYLESWSIYISEVQTTPVDAELALACLKTNQSY